MANHFKTDHFKRLRQYADNITNRHYVDFLCENPNLTACAKEFNVAPSTVMRVMRRLEHIASRMGDSEQIGFKAPAGFSVDRVSTFVDDEGKVSRQWVIANRDKEDLTNAMNEAIVSMCSIAESKHTPIEYDISDSKADMLTSYIIGDHHHSMLSWHEETGDDYDMTISEKLLKGAILHLTSSTQATDQALVINCGDWFHGNDSSNRTPKSGNVLDVDGRLTKIIRTGMMLMVGVIEECLKKHKTVHVRNALGNHSFTLEMFMSEFLSAWFRNDPRVVIHNEPKPFWYYQFGGTLLGVTHGDTIKPTELGELMAADCTDIWSSTSHRYWILGHVHSKHSWEMRTCIAESFNTLAGKDAWHNEHGYRSKRNMTAITYHIKHGEIARNTVDIGALSV